MKIKQILSSLDNEITRLRESVCKAGDTAGIVYIGEDIGKLQVAMALIKAYAENNEL